MFSIAHNESSFNFYFLFTFRVTQRTTPLSFGWYHAGSRFTCTHSTDPCVFIENTFQKISIGFLCYVLCSNFKPAHAFHKARTLSIFTSSVRTQFIAVRLFGLYWIKHIPWTIRTAEIRVELIKQSHNNSIILKIWVFSRLIKRECFNRMCIFS